MMNKNFMCKKEMLGLIVFSIVIVFILSQVVFTGLAYADETRIDKIKKAGKLVVGTSADYPPYEFHLLNDKEGELVGIDIDIARYIAKEFGVKLEIKDLIFSKIFDSLNSGQIDIAIAGIAPSTERKKIVNFSNVYYQAIQNILIRTDDAVRIRTIEDLRGKKVGIQKDSIQASMAQTEIPASEFVVRETIEELIIILDKGLVDAIILEEPVAESYVRQNKKFMSLKCKGYEDLLGSAIAVRKNDKELLKEINRILGTLEKEDRINDFVENAKMLTNKK